MKENIALITGASRGIGAATAKLLAQQNLHIIVHYHKNQEAALTVVEHIIEHDGSAQAIQADISQESDIIELFNQIDKINGKLTMLVNNAGILFQQSTIEALNAERISKVLNTNVTGTLLCCKEAVKRMAIKYGGNGGAIVNVSSAASRLGAPGEYIDYAASKGAIDTITIGLSLEVAEQKIRVNGVRPGLIYTEIHGDGGEPNRVDRLSHNIPMKRGGQPEEVAQAIVWLLSDKASYVTGSHIDLAGGK
ncbi:SDR family oxidoreductase [Thalassotalea sp. SU-HH00458]|uniref:SDR family oxidoreductase n=1 Tax=Thalassotalea sp. SU-HH00458 TaxID=3127657 RepID=UPI0031096C8F